MPDTKKRSIVKAFIYRGATIFLTTSLVWFITGDIELGLGLSLGIELLHTVFYLAYERFWNKIKWGKYK